MIAVGCILLAVTFLMGYELYISLPSLQSLLALQQNATNSGNIVIGNQTSSNTVPVIVGGISGLTSGITSSMNANLLLDSILIIKVTILFLFASVGYKFANLGISYNKTGSEKKEGTEEKEQKQGSARKFY